jgi:hypothetical protein
MGQSDIRVFTPPDFAALNPGYLLRAIAAVTQ